MSTENGHLQVPPASVGQAYEAVEGDHSRGGGRGRGHGAAVRNDDCALIQQRDYAAVRCFQATTYG